MKTIHALLLTVVLGLCSTALTQAFPIITNIVETGGDNDAADTVPAKWTGVTWSNHEANEPIPGLATGSPYTVGLFRNYAPCYVDRNHRYTNAVPAAMPPYLIGQEYIMSGNDNRDNASYLLNVSVSQSVIVYMLIDNRMGDASNGNPPTFGATAMQWILNEGWQPVTNGLNRTANVALPDEVAIDEAADNTINNWFSIYKKFYPAGTFVLRQADNTGNNMYGVVVAAANPPAAPTNLSAVEGDTKVTLTWSASAGANQYVVRRSTTSGGPYSNIGTNSSTRYIDTGLNNGTTYYYVVSARGTGGDSDNSSEVAATPKPAPQNVVAVGGTNQVQVSWLPLIGAATYTVKRSSTSGGPYTEIANGVL
ncbi:MAG TPA: fibronectin type III domain-containing protein, partial [Candidatus Binatia bacterium]|nr:fibronectin type III domain-containing protein [Candidatus Binatia bacterium]